MKRRKNLIMLGIAIACGGLAGYLALVHLGARPATATAAPAKSQVAVAVRDLPLGTILRAEDVRVVDWPSDALPAGYANTPTTLVGRGLITPVAVNEPLLSSKLADKSAGGGLPIVIPEGMRGISIRVDDVVSVAGFILPGTRVDVLVTLREAQGQSESATRTILQNMQVLAAGQVIQRDPEGKPQTVSVITLLVSPEQAERLTLAAGEGRIQLALRNTLDLTESETPGVRTSSLLHSPDASAAPQGRAVRVRSSGPGSSNPTPSAPRRTTVIETIRGGERTLSTFSSGKQ